MQLSKQQVKALLDKAPPNADKGKIIGELINRGYQLEGLDSKPQTPAETKAASSSNNQEPGIVQSIAQTIAKPILTTGATIGAGLEMGGAAGKMIAGKATGNEDLYKSGQQSAQDAYQKYNDGVDMGYLGKAKAIGGIGSDGNIQDVNKYAADTVSTGANLSTFAIPVAKGGLAAKTLAGAAAGYVGDVASNLQDENVKGLGNLKPGLGTVVGAALPIVGEAGKAIKNKVVPMVSNGASKVSSSAKNLIKPKNTTEEAIQQIIQGDKKDLSKAAKALNVINLNNVKTYSDLTKELDGSIPKISSLVDSELSKDPKFYTLKELSLVSPTKSGKSVAVDYVSRGLNALKELYTKTGDDVAAQEIDDTISALKNGGATKVQINNIARKFGEEFKSKAFSKTGDPLTSVNAQAYENIRKGLKDVARSGMSDTAKKLDEHLSSVYNTKKLVSDVESKVYDLAQKIEKRGLLAKVGHYSAKAVDVLSGGSIRGFIGGFLPRGAGYKTMNALDLEGALKSNLKIIDKALKSQSDDEIIKLIKQIGG